MEKLNVACFFCAVNYIFYISYSTSSQNDLQTPMACEVGAPPLYLFPFPPVLSVISPCADHFNTRVPLQLCNSRA